jgi:hypothetical protein
MPEQDVGHISYSDTFVSLIRVGQQSDMHGRHRLSAAGVASMPSADDQEE